MLKLIDRILQQFRICFKREETFSWFVIIVVGILVRSDMKGVSSIVGSLCLDPGYYESMLHFFRSQAFDLRYIKSKWQNVVLEHIKPVLMDGFIILIGYHIKVAKEARYMPWVKKIVSTMRAIEVFTFLSCMAMGILTTISLQFPTTVWNKFSGWLRTCSSEIPSIETVRSVLQQELWRNTYNLSNYATLSSIQKYQRPDFDKSYKASA